MVGVGGVIQFAPDTTTVGRSTETFSLALGPRAEQNLTSGELTVVAHAMKKMLPAVRNRTITIFTRNNAAMQMMAQSRQQSGQEYSVPGAYL